MLLLLEGPDGGGKTTLGQQLAKDGWAYQHNGPPPSDDPDAVWWWQLAGLKPRLVESATGQPVKHTVVDRSWPSGMIYHRFTGKPQVFDAVSQRMFERYLLTFGGAVVLCLPPYGAAFDAWSARVAEGLELLTEPDQFRAIYQFYQGWAQTTSVPVYSYDYTRMGIMSLDVDLQTALSIGSHRVSAHPDEVVGNTAASIAIIGERCNTRDGAAHPHLPFIGRRGSSVWLTHELMRAGIAERQLCWLNAQALDGNVTPHDRLPVGVHTIVTLGAVARQWAVDAADRAPNPNGWTRNIIELPHPAYWSRFHSRDRYPLHDHASLLRHLADDEAF